jgi:hypothetical protein
MLRERVEFTAKRLFETPWSSKLEISETKKVIFPDYRSRRPKISLGNFPDLFFVNRFETAGPE